MELMQQFRRTFGKSKMPRQIVFDLWKGRGAANYYLAEYVGHESSDFLAQLPVVNFSTLKDAVEKHLGGQDFVGAFLFRDECASDRRALERAADFCQALGFVGMKPLQDTSAGTLYWSGVAELAGPADDPGAPDAPWEHLEAELLQECVYLVAARIAGARLKSFTLRFTETLNATVNHMAERNQEDWIRLSAFHAGVDTFVFSGNQRRRVTEGQQLLKLLARVLLRLESHPDLRKLAGPKGFATDLVETSMWKVDPDQLRAFAERHGSLPLSEYLGRRLRTNRK